MSAMKSHRVSVSLLVSILAGVAALCSCASHGHSQREVWARVNGTPIYRDQVEAIYRRKRALPGAGKPEQALSFKVHILHSLIEQQLLLQQAAREMIAVSDVEVARRFDAVRATYSGNDFRKELAMQGLTPAALRSQILQNLLIEKLLHKDVESRVAITEAEISNYYVHNKGDFNVPDTEYHLAQILVATKPDPQVDNLLHDTTNNSRQAALKINAIYQQLRSGEDFAKVAEEYSEDPRTAPEGGDMGFVPASSLDANPALQRAVGSLHVGHHSEIIHDREGYHIVKLLGRVPAGQRARSDPQVQQAIRKTLTDEKEDILRAAYMENLRNRARVVDYLAQEILRTGGSASTPR
jgi:peptidyl-prolyl cis-trans isomerase SurA